MQMLEAKKEERLILETGLWKCRAAHVEALVPVVVNWLCHRRGKFIEVVVVSIQTAVASVSVPLSVVL